MTMLPNHNSPYFYAMLDFHASPGGFPSWHPERLKQIKQAMGLAYQRRLDGTQMIRATGTYPEEFARESKVSQWFMDTHVAPWLEEQRQRFLAAADEAAPPSTDAPSPEEQPA